MDTTQFKATPILTSPLVEQFQQVIANHELAHAYLLAGMSGTGKLVLAKWIALRLFCLAPQANQPDYTCAECQRILSDNHPDVVMVQPDGRQIKVDQIRYLKTEFTKRSVEGQQKVFIIDQADTMTVNAANSLLKFIEEPGQDVYIFLLTTNKQAILPTVQSRTQIVELPALSPAQLKTQLATAGIPDYLQSVVVGLTQSPQEATAWLVDDWLGQVVKQLLPWFKLVLTRDPLAYVEIQTKLLPLFEDRSQQKIGLSLVTLLMRDALVLKVDDQRSDLYFANWRAELVAAVQGITLPQCLAMNEAALALQPQFERNLNYQNVWEAFVIKCLTNK